MVLKPMTHSIRWLMIFLNVFRKIFPLKKIGTAPNSDTIKAEFNESRIQYVYNFRSDSREKCSLKYKFATILNGAKCEIFREFIKCEIFAENFRFFHAPISVKERREEFRGIFHTVSVNFDSLNDKENSLNDYWLFHRSLARCFLRKILKGSFTSNYCD